MPMAPRARGLRGLCDGDGYSLQLISYKLDVPHQVNTVECLMLFAARKEATT